MILRESDRFTYRWISSLIGRIKVKCAKMLIVGILAMNVPVDGFAYTECLRTVKGVWIAFDGTGVNVTFVDGGSSITKTETQLTVGQMSRYISVTLTALTTGRQLSIRYPEDNLICPPVAGPARGDITGMWLKE